MLSKKTLLTALLLTLTFLSAFAQVPDPRDSVLIESKFLIPSTGTPAATVRVWLTNKDTITSIRLILEEKSLFGGTYMTLAYPRTFDGVVTRLTSTLIIEDAHFGGYDSNSPDSFRIMTHTGGTPTGEPPNATRKAFYDIKFDSVISQTSGQVQFDTTSFLGENLLIINSEGRLVLVNFVKGIMSVSIDDVLEINNGKIPKQFFLSQNYPNPFNANTQISFALPKSGRTTLEVFNVLGQKISTLVDEYLSAGTKIVNWDGRDDVGMPVPSGIYFYGLRSGEFRETKKMLVLK